MTGGRCAVVAAAALVAALALPASGSDPSAFKKLKSRYDKLARKKDPVGNRARRGAILEMLDYLDQKSCRKLLRKAYDNEKTSIANRTAVVHVLGASPEAKDLDFLLSAFKKSRKKDKNPARAPVIALGRGLGYAAPADAAAVSAAALAKLPKSKGAVRQSLLEGVGILGAGASFEPLKAFDPEGNPWEHFERNVALGKCGKKAAVDVLAKDVRHPDHIVRMGTATGLADTRDEAAYPHLVKMLGDREPRVVEIAALALGEAKHEAAVPALIDAMKDATLRTRDELRLALGSICEVDYGIEHAAWSAWHDAKSAGTPVPAEPGEPDMPTFFDEIVPTDRCVVIFDTSRSMEWQGRLFRAMKGCVKFLESLPDHAEFGVYTADRNVSRFSDGPVVAKTKRGSAVKWVRDRTRGRSFDLNQVMEFARQEHPDADTYVIATDSQPWGTHPNSDPRETMEIFRRVNRTLGVRLFIALTVPGGRYLEREDEETEWPERIDRLTEMAELSGGAFILVDE